MGCQDQTTLRIHAPPATRFLTVSFAGELIVECGLTEGKPSCTDRMPGIDRADVRRGPQGEFTFDIPRARGAFELTHDGAPFRRGTYQAASHEKYEVHCSDAVCGSADIDVPE